MVNGWLILPPSRATATRRAADPATRRAAYFAALERPPRLAIYGPAQKDTRPHKAENRAGWPISFLPRGFARN